MFDIDGTLVQSYQFDEDCFLDAVKAVTGLNVLKNWETYEHMSDRGILQTFIQRQAKHLTLEELEPQVKAIFIENIKAYVNHHPVKEVKGAIEFFNYSQARQDVIVSIATGGWRETALIKLESAGFAINNIVMASSNDHHSRIQIMQLAAKKATDQASLPDAYFGDAAWDVTACDELGVNAIIVGNRVEHPQQIKDFTNKQAILMLLGRL